MSDSAIEYVAYGSTAALNAELGTPDYNNQYGAFASVFVGDGDWDADYFNTFAEAKAHAKHHAAELNVPANAF